MFDDKNINQPTGATSAIGDSPAYNLITNITQRGGLFGLEAVHFAEFWYNSQVLSNYTWNVAPGGNATLGRLSSFYDGGDITSTGAVARARRSSSARIGWATSRAGSNTPPSRPSIRSSAFPVTAVPAYTPIQRDFLNTAPEAGLLYRLDDAWQFRGRVGTGYDAEHRQPHRHAGGRERQQLAACAQTNVGIDLGTDWTPDPTLKLSVTGFYEFFRNELVTQSPGAGLQNFTFNVPKSVHRDGIEWNLKWRRRGTYNDSEESRRALANQINYFLNVPLEEHYETLRQLGLPAPVIEPDYEVFRKKADRLARAALAAMAERDPESGAAHGHDRHRQLDAKPYASGCAECKQLLLDQLQQPAFLRFIASSSNEHQYLLFDMRTSCRAFYQSDQPQRASSC